MSDRRAACSCGKLQVSVRGDPTRISVCHCLACQQRTGSVFGVQARYPASDVDITGESREFVRVGDEGNRISFHFCPDCGSTVYYYFEISPDIIAVAVGAFADPNFPAPAFSVYDESRRHKWVGLPEDIDRRG